MQVRNYYTLSEKELDKAIDDIRTWLFNFPNHEDYQRVSFALEVALSAKKMFESTEEEQKSKLTVDIICSNIYN